MEQLPSRITVENVPLFVEAARTGADDALSRLLESYRTYLRRVARRELAGDLRGKIDPSDLAQITLIEAHRDFVQFTSSTHSRLRTWLGQLMINNVADAKRWFRSTAKRDISREVPLDSSLKEVSAYEDVPREAVYSLSGQFQVALERLPQTYREIILLRHFERLSFPEIGQRMNKTTDAARMFYSRAMSALKSECEHDDQPDAKR
ncbi:MAG: sigma-70 family RNA polymerase sigma factor [Pirellulales bacterium]|nr:sigma-70 family RNA polymerase sigma factor [Pirellulales bacterium]